MHEINLTMQFALGVGGFIPKSIIIDQIIFVCNSFPLKGAMPLMHRENALPDVRDTVDQPMFTNKLVTNGCGYKKITSSAAH